MIRNNALVNIILQKTGLFIQPIKKVIPEITGENMYTKTLEKTAGAWREDLQNSNDIDSKTKKRNLELEASKARKKQW